MSSAAMKGFTEFLVPRRLAVSSSGRAVARSCRRLVVGPSGRGAVCQCQWPWGRLPVVVRPSASGRVADWVVSFVWLGRRLAVSSSSSHPSARAVSVRRIWGMCSADEIEYEASATTS